MKNSGKITEKQLLSFEIMQDLSLRDHSLKSEKLETILSLDFSLRANKGGISLKYSAFWNYYLKKKGTKKNIYCDFEAKHHLWFWNRYPFIPSILNLFQNIRKKCTWQNCILCVIAKYTRVNIKLTENYLSYHNVKKNNLA